MNTFALPLLQQTQQPGGGYGMLLMMVALFAVMYFFMIRPQNKKQKNIQKYRDSLTVGQDVVTIGGIHGTVKRIDDAEGTVSLNVATGVEIKFNKSSILPKEEAK